MHYFAGHLQHDMFWVLLSIPLLCLQAVEESLKSLNLFHGGVSDKQAGKYSGGMKRRLSVAISLIGDPKVCLNFISLYFAAYSILVFILCCLWYNPWEFCMVVYMDEPSTGLDPASMNNLWSVVKKAKQDRAIILTSSLSISLFLSHPKKIKETNYCWCCII